MKLLEKNTQCIMIFLIQDIFTLHRVVKGLDIIVFPSINQVRSVIAHFIVCMVPDGGCPITASKKSQSSAKLGKHVG